MNNQEIESLDRRRDYLVGKCRALCALLAEAWEVSARPRSEWFADVYACGFDTADARYAYNQEKIGPDYFALLREIEERRDAVSAEIDALPKVPAADAIRRMLERRAAVTK